MEGRVIARGLLSGAIGGVVAFLFGRAFVEPVIGRALEYEGSEHAAGHGGGSHDHGVELFSRGVQANVGMGFGVLAFAVAMGALLAVVFTVAYGRTGLAPRPLAAMSAGAMLLCLTVVPALKYPPSPPGVSLEETIRQRTLLYLLMVVVSAALLVGALYLGRRLNARLGGWNAALAAAAAYLVAVAAVMAVLPAARETPGHFPADVLYDFRLYAMLTQVVLWTATGLVFAELAHRLLAPKRAGLPV